MIFDRIIIWLFGITGLGTIVTWFGFRPVRIPNQWVSTINRVFRLKQIDGAWYLVNRPRVRTRVDMFHEYYHIFLLSLVMYAYGNWENRVNNMSWWSWLGLISSPVFGWLGQLRGMEFSVVPNFWSHLTIQIKVSMVILVIFLIGYLSYQLWCSYYAGELVSFMSIMICIPTVYLMAYLGSRKKLRDKNMENRVSWHIHHWFIGYYLTLWSRYSSDVSNFCGMIFWGVFLEGAISYGTEFILFGRS